jgi:cyclopropane fatty-acyl-phospholipid synthase-like methyltransferase
LEIGSGTGQHAAFFATALPHVTWQTSDLDENHATISAWVTDAAQPNLLPPLSLDVLTTDFPATTFDAVYSANTAHIMSMEAVRKMFELVGDVLSSGGVFCLYGPFRHEGVFNAPSNAAFHQQLQARDTAMGIRHLESLDEEGHRHQLSRQRLYAMPANNNMAVWQKEV